MSGMNTRKEDTIANGGRSVAILLELAKQALTMYDSAHLPRIARLFFTSIDNVAKCAERHDELLRHVKDQSREIRELKMQVRTMKSGGIGEKRQPWEMTTPEFMAQLKLEWKDPSGDECVSFGADKDDSPLCELPGR